MEFVINFFGASSQVPDIHYGAMEYHTGKVLGPFGNEHLAQTYLTLQGFKCVAVKRGGQDPEVIWIPSDCFLPQKGPKIPNLLDCCEAGVEEFGVIMALEAPSA